MTVGIHKVITGNPISKNLMKPWDLIMTEKTFPNQNLCVKKHLTNTQDQEI